MEFKRGSIIKRRLGGVKGAMIFHTGIYIDDTNIIHFNGVEKGDRNSIIQKVVVEEFAKGKKVKLHKSPESAAHGDSVCEKALEFLANHKNGFDYNYSLFSNNCQSFTDSCFETEYEHLERKNGKAPVSQVKKVLGFAVTAIGVVFFVAVKRKNKTVREEKTSCDRRAA